MADSVSFDLPKRREHEIYIETFSLLVINLAAFFGNLFVFLAVYRNQRLRTLANVFVIALSVSDIVIATCSMPFEVNTLYRGRWVFGISVCFFQGFVMFNFAMASLGTLGIIAVSRYFCVVKPQKYVVLFNKKRILRYIAAVWFAALIGSVPPLFFKEGGYQFQPAKAECMYTFETNIAYTVFIECVYISMPLTIIIICYAKVFITVSRSNKVFSHANNLQRLRANVEEAKVTKTLAAVMAGFAICWLPICIMDYIDAAHGEPTLPRRAYLTYGFLGYLSSAINPIIYGAMNKHFRREYKAIIKRAFCLHLCQSARESEDSSGSDTRKSQNAVQITNI